MIKPFEYRCEFKSSLDEVVSQIAKIISLLDSNFENYNKFVLDLILRETLNNAVIHGNKNRPDQIIKLGLGIEADQFHIVVEDEGAGFNWQSVIVQQSNPGYDHGRGFPIFQRYCNKIVLNKKGNRISLKMNVHKDIELGN
ncbi:MAG: ATP-binding protein [Candidatus Marinimicrobia bacterium]|nr:ATP-binding protein [Candidatus Neomarinimicrobiota bacterium]